MQVILAKTAGFCFGVDRALRKAYENIDGKKTVSLGPIIHNKEVVSDLADAGVSPVDSISDVAKSLAERVILRSHGVPRKVEEELTSCGVELVDVTCPYVKKIHHLASKAFENGHKLIIAGDKNHSEVVGIAGWYDSDIIYLQNIDDIEKVDFSKDETYELVAQTTFNNKIFKEMLSLLQKSEIRVIIRNTICSATYDRQKEASEIAKNVDVMVVIGDKRSSNTRKLYDICSGICERTYHIETVRDIDFADFNAEDVVGITAGASTPKKLIEEVISNVRNAK